jgi:DNA-binding XRE family transcriptional regulator
VSGDQTGPSLPESLIQLSQRVRKVQLSRLLLEPEIGETLRKIRLERKWTQRALASRLAISIDWLQKIELGWRDPNPALTDKIKAWLADSNSPVA